MYVISKRVERKSKLILMTGDLICPAFRMICGGHVPGSVPLDSTSYNKVSSHHNHQNAPASPETYPPLPPESMPHPVHPLFHLLTPGPHLIRCLRRRRSRRC